MRHLQHQSQHKTYTNHNMFPPSSIISAATSAINTHEHIISHCISTVPHHTSFWYYQTGHHYGPVLLCSSTSTVWPFPLVTLVPPHYSTHLSPPLMRGSLYLHACQHCLSNTKQRGSPHICMMNRLTTVYLTHTSYTSPSSDEGYPGLAGYTVTNTISGDCTAHPSQPTYSTSAGPGHIMQNIHTSDHQSPSQRLSFFSFFF